MKRIYFRLVNELRNWVLGHKEEWKRRSASQLEQPISKMEQQANRRRKIKGNSHKVMHSENKMASRELYESGKNELQLFMAMDGKYRRFLNAIHRRNDTFYVVSFRKVCFRLEVLKIMFTFACNICSIFFIRINQWILSERKL